MTRASTRSPRGLAWYGPPMGNDACARCGATIDPSFAAYSSDGLVCESCHLTDQQADEEQMRAAAENRDGLGLGGPMLSFTQTRTETRHADGTVTVDEDAALDGWAMRFFRAIFKK